MRASTGLRSQVPIMKDRELDRKQHWASELRMGLGDEDLDKRLKVLRSKGPGGDLRPDTRSRGLQEPARPPQ